jgi:hypothetical protein
MSEGKHLRLCTDTHSNANVDMNSGKNRTISIRFTNAAKLCNEDEPFARSRRYVFSVGWLLQQPIYKRLHIPTSTAALR